MTLSSAARVAVLMTVPAFQSAGASNPPISPPCVILPALLTSPDLLTLEPGEETSLDTARLQNALDHCSSGQSVRLTPQGRRQAFLSGPIQLRSGVTLVLEKGVVLFGSREARDYQVKQGSCGVVDEKGHGCRPLISGERVLNAGLMGEGIIDGRGDSAILGETYSWWDLAEEARLRNGKVNAPGLLVLNDDTNYRASKLILRRAADKPIRQQQKGKQPAITQARSRDLIRSDALPLANSCQSCFQFLTISNLLF